MLLKFTTVHSLGDLRLLDPGWGNVSHPRTLQVLTVAYYVTLHTYAAYSQATMHSRHAMRFIYSTEFVNSECLLALILAIKTLLTAIEWLRYCDMRIEYGVCLLYNKGSRARCVVLYFRELTQCLVDFIPATNTPTN